MISAIAFIRAPQLGHASTSIAKTRCISSAHQGLRSRGGAQLFAANDPTRNAALAAVIAAASALLGGRPRPSFTTYARRLGCRRPRPDGERARYTRRAVRPYPILEHVVVVLARTLDHAVKRALVLSGPELPMRVMLDEPVDRGDRCTHRISIEPDEREDDSVRVVLHGCDSDNVQAERTIRWDGDPARTEDLITAIRELAGLDAT